MAILATGVVAGLIPILATRRNTGDRFLSLGNAAAGGTFLGAGFLHLLPEASEVLDSMLEYPLGPLLTVAGVCLLLLIDRVVFELVGPVALRKPQSGHKPHHHLILLVVLSIHAAIAGVAVGLERETATLLLLTGAILCHKGAASFALVVCTLSAQKEMTKVVTALGVFALMTPIGILFGISSSVFLSERSSIIFEGSFNALAAGTFIYIAILDIIDAEFSTADDRIAYFTRSALGGADDRPMPQRDPDRVIKFLLIMCGVAAMALMRFWE